MTIIKSLGSSNATSASKSPVKKVAEKKLPSSFFGAANRAFMGAQKIVFTSLGLFKGNSADARPDVSKLSVSKGHSSDCVPSKLADSRQSGPMERRGLLLLNRFKAIIDSKDEVAAVSCEKIVDAPLISKGERVNTSSDRSDRSVPGDRAKILFNASDLQGALKVVLHRLSSL